MINRLWDWISGNRPAKSLPRGADEGRTLDLGGKTDAVFIERDQNFPDEQGWRDEVRHVRRIAEEVAGHQSVEG